MKLWPSRTSPADGDVPSPGLTRSQLERMLAKRDGTLRLLVMVVAFLSLFAVITGSFALLRVQSSLAEARRSEALAFADAKQLAENLDRGITAAPGTESNPNGTLPAWRDPRDVRWYAYEQQFAYAIKKPRVSSLLDAGQQDLLPSYYRVTVDARDKALRTYEYANPHALLLGSMDAAFVLLWLLPLGWIASTIAVGASERERHMIEPLAATGVWLGGLWARRILLRVAALLVPFLLVTNAAVLLMALVQDGPLLANLGEALLDLAGWNALSLLYAGFWAALLLVAAARGSGTSRNAATLATLYVGLLVLGPALATFVARTVHPAPTRHAYVQAMRDATDQVTREADKLQEQWIREHPALLPPGQDSSKVDWPSTRLLRLNVLEQRTLPIEQNYADAVAAQAEIVSGFETVLPPLLIQDALNRITGTDSARHTEFLERVGTYHRELRAWFFPKMLAMLKAGASAPKKFEAHADWPRFEPVAARNPLWTSGFFEKAALLVLASLILVALGLGRRSWRSRPSSNPSYPVTGEEPVG